MNGLKPPKSVTDKGQVSRKQKSAFITTEHPFLVSKLRRGHGRQPIVKTFQSSDAVTGTRTIGTIGFSKYTY